MLWMRVFIGAVIAAIVAIAIVPLFVLLELVDGGDGYGLCPDGLGSCRSSYFDGPELLALLVVVLFILLGVLRLAILLYRRMRAHQAGATPRGFDAAVRR